MKKTDLSKYLNLSAEDQTALGMVPDSDPYKKVAAALQNPQSKGSVSEAMSAPYVMGKTKVCAARGRHRVTLRERQDLKPRRIGEVLYTPHTCLECGNVLWKVHPGPRRQLKREDEANSGS